MLGQRPTAPREADHREPSLRSVMPLVAAAALFIFGLVGLLTVLPYSRGAGVDAVFVTSPSQSPQPSRDEARVQEVATPAPPAKETIEAVTEIPATVEPVATEAPTQAPRFFAAALPDAPVVGLTPEPDPPTPTPTPEPPTPEPTPTATPTEPPPTATPTRTRTATPTPTLPDFIADPREEGTVKPAEPVTAFIDTTFQQPAPVAPAMPGGADNQMPVTPGR